LKEVCHDVKTEPTLVEVNGEVLQERTANVKREARLDISALSFWIPGQRVFFGVRVFNLHAQRYRCSELKRCFQTNEKEKKRQYNERVLQIENGTFTPLMFATNGAMAQECQAFYKNCCKNATAARRLVYDGGFLLRQG